MRERYDFIRQIRTLKLSDKALLALSLAAESLGIDSEHFLFKQLLPEIEGLIERSVYNRRVRRLRFKLEEIRQKMIDEMTPNTDLYIVCHLKFANSVALIGVKFAKRMKKRT